jgi:H+/gluconate symporter-like permease
MWIQPFFLAMPFFFGSVNVAWVSIFLCIISTVIFNSKIKKSDNNEQRYWICFIGSFLIMILVIVFCLVWSVAMN